jgi:hypothetical protein
MLLQSYASCPDKGKVISHRKDARQYTGVSGQNFSAFHTAFKTINYWVSWVVFIKF